jgi:acyl carrier protein
MTTRPHFRQDVRTYILNEFLPGEPADTLTNDTPLVGDGILSSIDTLKLITFLEDTYKISIDSHEVVGGPLKTVDTIVTLILDKLNPG